MTSFDRAHMTSYRCSVATMAVSEINGDFGRKSQIFPTPCILRPTEGVPLGIGYWRRDQKTRVMGLPGGERSLTIFSAVWIEYTNYVTDGRTDTGRQQRPRLRIALNAL